MWNRATISVKMDMIPGLQGKCLSKIMHTNTTNESLVGERQLCEDIGKTLLIAAAHACTQQNIDPTNLETLDIAFPGQLVNPITVTKEQLAQLSRSWKPAALLFSGKSSNDESDSVG